MENIYSLGEKFFRISEAYDCAKDALEAEYEANGGEVTEVTETMQAELDVLESLRREVVEEVLSAPDDYAAIVKNAEAQKKVLEAELKAVKEEQAKIVAKIESRIRRKQSKVEWFKESIAQAMRLAEINKIGGQKTENRFTIWFKESKSVEADEERLLTPYNDRIQALIDALPKWLTVKTGINKTALKAEAEMPEGAHIVTNKTLQIL